VELVQLSEVDELIGEWVSEWMSEWRSEWRSEWMSERTDAVQSLWAFAVEDGSWGTGIVREPRVREMSAIGSYYQTRTGEDTTDWEDFMCAVVNCRVCELVVVL
jgi:hypothetical protein